MISNKLDLIFYDCDNCKEHCCKVDKKSINKVYKPDSGIKDQNIIKKIFGGGEQPKLSDCVIIYNKSKLAIVEIKCGEVTKKLIDDTVEKITNVCKILEEKKLKPAKLVLIYKSFENTKLGQILQGKTICGQKIIGKKYKNQAINLIKG